MLFVADVNSANVEGVRLWRAPDHTRLVFDLSGPVEHKIFSLKQPDRIVIDIDKSQFKASLASLDFDKTSISKMRYGKRDKDDLRVVLDMAKTTQPRSFVLKKHAGKPDRLVIDIYGEGTKTQKTVAKVQPSVGSKKDILIAIDAGHGGEDPGSIGPGGIYEKTVVLKISKALKSIIDKEPGFKATLIRNGDYYVENTLRRQKAREMRADLFVSIHSDGFTDPRAKGASVFALSRRGATSQMARILASKANESDLIGGAGSVSLSDKDDVLAGVLVDLSMTATLASSLDVGGRVLKNMGSFTSLHKNHVEQAAFIVLKSPDVPSILVETGFITNPKESKKLKSPAHQQKLAKAVFKGIKAYFYDNPPEGTYVAWKKYGGKETAGRGAGGQSHTIAAGDTLSSIAKKYKISVTELKNKNKLTSSTIRIGQVLTIPAS
ncbi:N-acetylmuramoyl-L-alanine amidase [Agarilytica rhodophyticola]|uniref:N-acetylmuramoyl-L-alanine amidase n=1 Tax=Agarilytica rhodophyticola TaxID=1737490 RepID=UPI001C200149|nr:N-acetylmuramoyl-L-alanine amidase [Agarilytica rhodophyticola]